MKIEKVAILHDKTEYIVHIRNLKQPFSHGIVSEKLHEVVKLNQKPV